MVQLERPDAGHECNLMSGYCDQHCTTWSMLGQSGRREEDGQPLDSFRIDPTWLRVLRHKEKDVPDHLNDMRYDFTIPDTALMDHCYPQALALAKFVRTTSVPGRNRCLNRLPTSIRSTLRSMDLCDLSHFNNAYIQGEMPLILKLDQNT